MRQNFHLRDKNSITVGGGYYGTARALLPQTLDLFIFRALRDRGLRDTSKVTFQEEQNFLNDV